MLNKLALCLWVLAVVSFREGHCAHCVYQDYSTDPPPCNETYPIEIYRNIDHEDPTQSYRRCCDSTGAPDELRRADSCQVSDCMSPDGDLSNMCSTVDPIILSDGTRVEWEDTIHSDCSMKDKSIGVEAVCCRKNSTDVLMTTLFGAEEHEFPFFARVKFCTKSTCHNCGGAIYNKDYIITAAHCTVDKDKNEAWPAKYGSVTLAIDHAQDGAPEDNVYKVEKVIPNKHSSKLNPDTMYENYFDIAVLKLARSIKFNSNKLALRIPSSDKFTATDYATNTLIMGFGDTDTLRGSTVLLKANAILRNTAKYYGGKKHEEQYLTLGGYDDGVFSASTGKGDSGGPAVCRDERERPVLCGLDSFGGNNEDCNDGKKSCKPKVFTKIAHFRDWIKENAGEQDDAQFFEQPLYGKAVGLMDYQSQVRITSDEGKSCGGTLISRDVVTVMLGLVLYCPALGRGI